MPPIANTSSDNLRGCIYMLLAMASFALGDTILKLVNSVLPLSQILVIRGLFAFVMLFALALLFRQLRSPRTVLSGAFFLRLFGEVLATLFFLTALFNMPMANAAAILQALPLTVSLGAAYFFGEAIGWRRITAILVGFAGVLLIVQPGYEGFTIYSIYCLIAVCATTLRDLATRRLPSHIPSLFVSLVTVFVIVLIGLIMSIFEDWQPVSAREIGALGVASLFLMSGFFSIISAMRVGEVGVVTPFRYSVLIFAVVLGYLIFDEWPNALTITGSVIVVASGLYTLYRETIVHRRKPSQAGIQP